MDLGFCSVEPKLGEGFLAATFISRQIGRDEYGTFYNRLAVRLKGCYDISASDIEMPMGLRASAGVEEAVF